MCFDSDNSSHAKSRTLLQIKIEDVQTDANFNELKSNNHFVMFVGGNTAAIKLVDKKKWEENKSNRMPAC